MTPYTPSALLSNMHGEVAICLAGSSSTGQRQSRPTELTSLASRVSYGHHVGRIVHKQGHHHTNVTK